MFKVSQENIYHMSTTISLNYCLNHQNQDLSDQTTFFQSTVQFSLSCLPPGVMIALRFQRWLGEEKGKYKEKKRWYSAFLGCNELFLCKP